MILRFVLIVVILTIGYLSLTPRETFTIGNDKLSHIIAYTTLMIVLGVIYFEKRALLRWSIVFAITYGVLLEIGQHFVPGRDTSLIDIVANVSGVILGLLIIILLYKPLLPLLKSLGIK